jgi:hypothetical protein
MRGITRITVIALAAVAIAVPATALATRGGDDNRGSKGDRVAATVASFENGVLTLNLADGSTLSGRVTRHTKIRCKFDRPATPPAQSSRRRGGDRRGRRGLDDERGRGNRGRHRGFHRHAPCGPNPLVTGARVKEAELDVRASGKHFDAIKLRVAAPTTS